MKRAKKKVGRPLELNEDVKQKIVNALRIGNFREVAARCAGISARTLKTWMAKGRKQHQGIYRELVSAVHRAEAEAESRMVQLVASAAVREARHAEWWLERKKPDRWGKRLELTGNAKKPLHVVNDDALLGKLKRLEGDGDGAKPPSENS